MFRLFVPFRLLLLCQLVISCSQQTKNYSILDYGARGDGRFLNTNAINNAIKSCHDKGGGTVVIPAGVFLSGTIELLSNISLYLTPGAVLKGSADTSDYLVLKSRLFNEGYTRYGLIYAENAANLSVTGEGQIDGNGTFFMKGIDKPHIGHDFDRKFTRQDSSFMKQHTIFEDGPVSYDYRPGMLITLSHCENVHINDVYIKDSPEWTMRIGDCDNVFVKGITINNNPLIPNNDGIHCTTSRNVMISDCNILTGDDAIIVSGFGNDSQSDRDTARHANHEILGNKSRVAENVTVTNCILSSRSSCIRVGYGEHPIRNLVFSNLVMHGSNRGIGIFSRNKSNIQHVLFSNIVMDCRLHDGHWWGKGEPIHISAIKDESNARAGRISDIRFSNIVATAETGIVIYGVSESIVENIFLDKVKLTIKRGKYSDSYGGNFDLRPAYPVSSAIFKHDIPGLYAQYVKGLTISGFELNWGEELPSFFTNGIEINHFDDLAIEGMKGNPASSSSQIASIKISEGANARLENNFGTDQKKFSLIKQNVK